MITTILLLAIIIFINDFVLAVNVLAFTGILMIIAYRFKRNDKYDFIYYIAALILSGISLFFDAEVIRNGVVGFGFMHVVMFTGVFPDPWLLTKRLRLYRGFYSILSVLLIFPHAYINLFVDKQVSLFGIAGLIIMLPLFATSFKLVRKEMKLSEWNRLQKIAYIVYVILLTHLVFMADMYGKIIYAVLLTLYINNKLYKELKKRPKETQNENT